MTDLGQSGVWTVWSEADYYGPHLQSVHATEESARAEAVRRAAEDRSPQSLHPADSTWPFIVEHWEVKP